MELQIRKTRRIARYDDDINPFILDGVYVTKIMALGGLMKLLSLRQNYGL